jgi:3-oxoacyl-[acyl-carrier-protein] synthase III
VQADISNISISKLVGVVPKNISYFDDEITNYSHDKESSAKLKKVMGYNQHRVVSSNATVSDMAVAAFNELLATGLDADTIDALIVVTQTPDFHIPATSAVLHGALDLKQSCYCIDINDGCTGFVKGLFEASAFVRSSGAKRLLLITGDVLSRKVSTKDRNSYPLVGDAVTICVIDAQEDDSSSASPLELLFDGKGALALNIPAGGSRLPSTDKTRVESSDDEGNIRSSEQLVMQGRDVFTFTQTTVINFLTDFRNRHCNQMPVMYFFHQANLFILDRLRKALKVTENELPTDVISNYGNSSSATIPMAIITSYERAKESFVSAPVMLAGFGVGLSWGAALVKLDKLDCCKLIERDY